MAMAQPPMSLVEARPGAVRNNGRRVLLHGLGDRLGEAVGWRWASNLGPREEGGLEIILLDYPRLGRL
jgi:hypothetical protein